jgi:hypothetical protein
MKRSYIKRGTKELSRGTKRIAQQSPKKRKQRASLEGADDALYREQVLAMPCMFCEMSGLRQCSPTTGHHAWHRRYSNRKRPDQFMLPVCDGHHQGMFDNSKISLEREPAAWKALYGDDIDHVATIQMRILGYTIPDPCALRQSAT